MANSLRILFWLASITATAIGCGWISTSHSVRFNGYQTEREMGRLPPLPTMAHGLNELRAAWEMEDPGQDPDDAYNDGEKRTEKVNALWQRAQTAETDGNLQLDRDLLNEYLKQTEIARDPWFSPEGNRNSAVDRLDALNALDRGSNKATVKAYLEARQAYDCGESAEQVQQSIELVQPDRNIKDNVAYLQAAERYDRKEFEKAAEAFTTLARQYPNSEKRAAALFMAAVATMKTSATYITASGNSDYKDDVPALAPDQAWHDAFAAFQKVVAEYPHSRYFNDARGWLGYLLLRKRDRAGALAQYYRLLADKNENARIEAALSLTLVRSGASDDEMSRVETELADEPAAALAYAYHNIYNYSIDIGSSYPPYDDEQINNNGEINYEAEKQRREEREKEWSQKRAAEGRKELTRILNFSRRLIAKYPHLSVGGAFALRAAQASEELEDSEATTTFARRALQSDLNADQRAEALWTLGIADQRLRRFDSARQNFARLLHDYPGSQLTEGARRTLAMIAEDAGDIDGALEQYVALDYDTDVAYFVDILMTPEQLAGFIQRHPDSPKFNEFTYALGIRYLRTNHWEDARRTFGQVRTSAVGNYNYYYDDNCIGPQTVNCRDPKEGETDDDGNGVISPMLVMRDVQTANELEALEQAVNQAEGDEAQAEALYQMASYQYQASSLLFYNPLATPGYWNLATLAREGRYRVVNEAAILWQATKEHDRLARALDIYLDTADRFPQTRAARDALYTAAVCHERLSEYNPYWRDVYDNGLHAGKRMVTYQDVKAAYPNYQLPRGTYGWQPSTRTVNGGPGWQAPPKPPIRLTRTARVGRMAQRVDRLAQRVNNSVETFWRETGRRWLTEIVIVALLFCARRITARNRKRLRVRLARQRIQQSRQAVTYPWLEMFWIDHLEPSRREQIGKFLGEKRREFLELAGDRRSRPVLVRNIASHTIMIGLLMSLIWTIW